MKLKYIHIFFRWTTVIFALLYFLFDFSDFEFLSNELNQCYSENAIFILLALFFVFAITYPVKAMIGIQILVKISVMVLCSFLFYMTAFAIAFAEPCKWSTLEVLYENRTNSNHRLEKRVFTCGTLSNTPKEYDEQVFESTTYFNFFIKYSKYNKQIDTTIWK